MESEYEAKIDMLYNSIQKLKLHFFCAISVFAVIFLALSVTLIILVIILHETYWNMENNSTRSNSVIYHTRLDLDRIIHALKKKDSTLSIRSKGGSLAEMGDNPKVIVGITENGQGFIETLDEDGVSLWRSPAK